MDDYIMPIMEGIPITPQEFIDGEHPWMPTDRVAGAVRLSAATGIPVTEIMFGQMNTTQYFSPRNSYR